MAISLADAKRERDDANEELEKVHSQVEALIARQDELRKVVSGWDAIVAEKQKQSGEIPIPISEPSASQATNNGAQAQDEGETNKTQFVRDRIRANKATGTTVDDLRQAAKANGIEHAASWPYGPLARLKKNGEVVKRRGKYYPVETPPSLLDRSQ